MLAMEATWLALLHVGVYWASVRIRCEGAALPLPDMRLLAVVLANQLIVFPLLLYMLVPSPDGWWHPMSDVLALLAVLLGYEVCFPCMHHVVHHVPHVHSLHHQVPLAPGNALAMHPVDAIWSGYLPAILPLVAFMLATTYSVSWMGVGVLVALLSHGTVISHAPGTLHAIHHAVPTMNFGDGFFVVDKMWGTFRSRVTVSNTTT